jgi:hypothetical protein
VGKLLSNLKDDRALSYLDKETACRAVREADEFVAAVDPYITDLVS